MDLFLFLITIFCLPLITKTQPFIDCSGKSFLCENSTHFTICVDVGGGVSMTVGNIVLSCPPTTFCDENNTFECEYRTSTSITPNPTSQGTDITTETTEASLTTNIYDEFLFTSDSQQAEEHIVSPTQQKYIIPGNANVIFDDTDNAVLVYGNIDSEVVNSTSINEKITKNVNVTNSENINDLKNKINDMNKKFTRRDEESTPKLEESRNELSSDTTDKMMTSFSEMPSDSVTTEEYSTLEYVTNTKNIEISATTSISLPDIGSELSNITHNSSNLKNISENIIKNNKNIDIETNFTVNKLADNESSSIIIERSPFNALESNSNLSNAVSNDVNISHNDEIITDKAKELLNMATESYIQNTTYSRDISPNSSAHLNETISTLPEESVILTTSTPVKIVTSNLNTPTEIYAQNDVFSRGIVLPDSVDFNSAGNVLNITTLRSDKLGDNENIIYFEDLVHPTTKVDNVTSHMSTTTKTYSLNGIMPNPIIPPESSELDITFGDILKVNKDLTDLQTPKQLYFTEKAVLNSTIKPDNQESSKTTNYSSFDNDLHIKLGKNINKFNFDVRNSTGQDTITDKNSHIRNKNTNTANIDSESSNVSTDLNTDIITDKTMLGMETLNSTLYTDVEAITEFNTENVVTLQQTNSYQTTLRSNDLGEIKNTFFEDTDYSVLIFPASTVETLVTELSTTPKTYLQNDIISNPIIPNDSPDFDISFGDLIKGNEDFIELKSPLQIPFTDRPISDFTGRSESRESLRNFRSTSQNNSSNYDITSNSSDKVTKTNDIFDRTETITNNISVANVTDPHEHFVNNEAVIAANESTNKELLSNKTNTTLNSALLIPNTKNVLNTAKIRKEIIEKIPNADEIIPRYNLTNHGLNITTDLDVKNYTNLNKTQYSLGDEKRVIDKVPLSNVLLKNVTGNFQNLNEKDIEEVEIMNTTSFIRTLDDIRKDNQTIKRSDSELLNDRINELIYPTQFPTETSYSFTNTESATINYNISENKTINLLKNNTIDLFKRVMVENMTEVLMPNYSGKILKNDSVVPIEDTTKPIMNSFTYTAATISNPANSKDQTNEIPEKAYITEGSILNSSTLLDKITENQPTILFNGNTKNGLDTFIFYKEIDEKIQQTLNVLNSTKSTSETSNYLKNTEGITVSYDQNDTIDSLKNNTTDLLQSETQNNREIVNNKNVVSSVKAVTKPVLNTSIFTSVDLVKNIIHTAAPISNIIINNDQTEKIYTSRYITEVPMLDSFLVLDKVAENQPVTEKNIDQFNYSSLYNTENTTERTLHTPTFTGNESILNDTFVDVLRKNQTASPISSSNNNEGQETDFTDSPTVTTHKDPIVNSSLTIKNRQNKQEKQFLMEDNRRENVNEFVSNNSNIVTQPTLKKPVLKINSFIADKVKDSLISGKAASNINQFNSTKHSLPDNSKSLSFENKEENVTEGNTQPVINNVTTSITLSKFFNTTNSLKPKKSTFPVFNTTDNSIRNKNISTIKVFTSHSSKTLLANESVLNIAKTNISNETVTKLEQENVNSKSNFDLFYDKSDSKGELQLKQHNVTTKSMERIAKLPEETRDEKITEQSQHNIKNLTLLKESKNESVIQKCSNKSICISQANGQVSIELYNKTRINVSIRNKTDSKTMEMRVQDIDHVLNTTVITVLPKTNNNVERQNKTTPLIPTYLNKTIVGYVNTTGVKNITKSFKDGLQLQTSDLGKTNVSYVNKNSNELLKEIHTIYNSSTKNHELKRQIQNKSLNNITIVPLVTTHSKEYQIVKTNEMPIKHIQTTKSSLILPNSESQSRTTTSKTNIKTPTSVLTFDCRNHSRGRYADKDNCRKFYICIGYSTPIVGFCPENTVFSEFKKQCTNNLSHCIRNNQFKCMKVGRFIDVWQDNMYYLCVKGSNNRFLRLKLQCKSGYIIDKVNVMCKQGNTVMKLSSSTSSNSSSSSSSSSSDKKKNKSNKKSNKKLSNNTNGFKCNEEGKFVDPNNCRKYYVCSKTSKSVLRRKRKKCDSDEVFDDDKKKCVDEDSYECK